MIERNLNAEILGKPYKTEHEITIQSLKHGKSLNTGELVVLQKEVNPLLKALKKVLGDLFPVKSSLATS